MKKYNFISIESQMNIEYKYKEEKNIYPFNIAQKQLKISVTRNIQV